MARTITAGRIAFAQPDFFEFGARKAGLSWTDLQMQMFVDGSLLAWGLSDGTFVANSSVGAGLVFFNEIPSASGFYLVRFFPDRPGFWRIVLRHPTLGEVVNEFDAVSAAPPFSGLQASFGP